MAIRVIDLGARIQAAFGYVSANVSQELKHLGFADKVAKADVFVQDTRTTFEQITLRRSYNGSGIIFGYSGFMQQQGNVFAPPPMVTFRKRKRIEVTSLDGAGDTNKAGEVVENYGHEPWEISFQGILIDMENHNYPAAKVLNLVEIFNIDEPWYIEGKIFSDHKISTIYFTDINSAGVQGFEDTWSFTLTAKSINPVEYGFVKQI